MSCEPVWALPCSCITSDNDILCKNSFAAIFDNDDDEELEVMNALHRISPVVHVGPKKSQRDRKTLSAKPLSKSSISSIARQVRSGQLSLPDLDLDSNESYDAVWALVDSGAARSCARRKGHFPNTVTQLQPSTVRMATASGEELKSRGCFTLDALSAEGNEINPTFEDADVDMPILSVAELSTNGIDGSSVIFRNQDGVLTDLNSNAASRFVKRKGVYFMKLYVPKDKVGQMDFHRPGTP